MKRNPDILSARIFEGTEDQLVLRFSPAATPDMLRRIASGIVAEAERAETTGETLVGKGKARP